MTQVLHAPVMRHFLDFEKPIAELEGKIEELRRMAGGDSINVADEIARLTDKADRQLRATYAKLTAWQKTQVARHPQRPKASDYVRALITDFTPLAGDRAFGDDAAVIGGLGRFGAAGFLRGRTPADHRPGIALRHGPRPRHGPPARRRGPGDRGRVRCGRGCACGTGPGGL